MTHKANNLEATEIKFIVLFKIAHKTTNIPGKTKYPLNFPKAIIIITPSTQYIQSIHWNT